MNSIKVVYNKDFYTPIFLVKIPVKNGSIMFGMKTIEYSMLYVN